MFSSFTGSFSAGRRSSGQGNSSAPYVTSGLKLYYDPRYYVSGTTIPDLSESGFDGTLVNGVDTSASNSGYLSFDGADDRIVTPNMLNAFSSTKEVTLEMWLYGTAGGSAAQETGSATPADGWYYNMIEYHGYGPTFYYYGGIWDDQTPYSQTSAPGVATPGLWNQVTLTYDGTYLKMYRNGSVGVEDPAVRMVPWESAGAGYQGYFLNFGPGCLTKMTTSGTANWSGRMGIIRMYNRALSQSEVQQNYQVDKSTYGLY